MLNYKEATQPNLREKAVYDNTGTIECRIVMYYVLKHVQHMLLLFPCGMKAHTPVMYTGSEKSWNGGRARL